MLEAVLTGVSLNQAVANILSHTRDGGKHYICVFAVDSLLRCQDSPELRRVQQAADMTLCDGMPLVFTGRKIARLDMDRCYGPDVMLRVIDEGRPLGLKHFFYGGKDGETVLKLESNLLARFPDVQIVGYNIPPLPSAHRW